MTKDNNDIRMESLHASSNNYWKNRRGRTVYIPKKIGRSNPHTIKTDSFDFKKLVDTVQSVGDQVNKVSSTVQKVSTNVGNAVQSVSNAAQKANTLVQNVKQTATNVQSVVKQPRASNTVNMPNNGYPQQPQASGPAINSFLTDTVYGIPLPFALMTAGLIVYIIVKLAKR